MKKLFLLGLTLALIATIEGFQSSAQKQMMAEMPRLKWASAGYASACYEVQFTAGQQASQCERIAELIAVGQESEASEEDRLNARKLAVMEVKPDAESVLQQRGTERDFRNAVVLCGTAVGLDRIDLSAA